MKFTYRITENDFINGNYRARLINETSSFIFNISARSGGPENDSPALKWMVNIRDIMGLGNYLKSKGYLKAGDVITAEDGGATWEIE